MVQTRGGSRRLLIQNLEEIPTDPQGYAFHAHKKHKGYANLAQPAFIYPSVSVCSAGTGIVPCVAIIACNLHRICAGNSALISNKAGRVSIGSTAI